MPATATAPCMPEPRRQNLQHRDHLVDGFSNRHNATKLVWYELHESIECAITREKQIKKWNRAWKIRLIEEMNPNWDDLYPKLFE